MIHQLKNLKHIEPDQDFLIRSRSIILTSPQRPGYLFKVKNAFGHTLKLSLALGLMAIMLTAVSGRLLPTPSFLLASINNRQLTRELSKTEFNIQLAEANYYKEIEQIDLALNEIIGNSHASY